MMTEESYRIEQKLLEICDKSCNLASTNRIRAKKHQEWKLRDMSKNYFLSSLTPDDYCLLKRFIHADTLCNATNMAPSYWRVQGFICLGDILDYIEKFKTQDERQIALIELLKKIQFDKWYSTEDWNKCNWEKGELVIIEYNGLTYIKIIEYDALHRIL